MRFLPLGLWPVLTLAALGPGAQGPARAQAPAAASSNQAASNPADDAQTVDDLVAMLASDLYAQRHAAQRRLAALGLAAFDPLYAASDADDPEVAAASRRLLAEMTADWSWPGDPRALRMVMDLYGRAEEAERRAVVTRLVALPDHAGMAGLCRIARYDLAPGVASLAAAAAMKSDALRPPPERCRAVAEARRSLDAMFGPSTRETDGWLALFERMADGPAACLEGWRGAVGQQLASGARGGPRRNPAPLEALYWNMLRSQLAAGAPAEGAADTVAALVALAPDGAPATVGTALNWMVDAQADAAAELLIDRQQGGLTSKEGLYVLASARRKRGQAEAARELASRALAAESTGEGGVTRNGELVVEGRVLLARSLNAQGDTDWARAEFAAAADHKQGVTPSSAYAAWLLVDSLQDHGEHAAAAAELGRLLDAIDADGDSRRAYDQLVDRWELFLEPAAVLRARRAYYTALARRAAGDEAGTRAALTEACGHDPTDADILIAMHRAAGADAAWREETRKRIRRLASRFEQQIDEAPSDPVGYNQWAWLIANTEGDFDKAVRYSERSLTLSPDNAGYLDTLARCCFAAGDLERAVRVQRRAVALEPTLRVMQRQLDEFERALADRGAPGGPPPTDGPITTPEGGPP